MEMETQKYTEKPPIRAKVRLDYMARAGQRSLWVKRKSPEDLAEEVRSNQAANLKNLVFPGVKVKDIDVSCETYSMEDPQTNSHLSFSPAILTVDADSLEDLAEFAMRDEFRSVDILEPFEIRLSGRDTGRLLALMNRKVREQAMIYARHLNQQQ